jgi:hypothetical protein
VLYYRTSLLRPHIVVELVAIVFGNWHEIGDQKNRCIHSCIHASILNWDYARW